MTVRVKVVINRTGVAAVTRSPMIRRELERRAELVRFTAVQLSPIRTGRYRGSWAVRSGVRARGAYAQVVNSAPYAIYVESGNSQGAPAQRVARRALRAAVRG